MSAPEATPCGCLKCQRAWLSGLTTETPLSERLAGPGRKGWRYGCEVCGNKRCPHHSDHTLACTGRNQPGQPGSVYA